MRRPTKEQIERWQVSRQKGIWRFILVRGILLWGLPIGLGFALYKQLVQDDMLGWKITFPIWTIGGIFFGALLWYVEGRMFSKHIAENNKQTPKD